MAVVSGKSGAVVFATGYVNKVRRWTVDITSEDVDITALGEKWQTHLAGINGFSGSYEALLDASVLTHTSGTTDPTLSNLELGAVSASAKFVFDETATATGGLLRGNIIVTGVSISDQQQGGAVVGTFTFVGDGALHTTAS